MIINFFENRANQTSKFRTKKWVEMNDDSNITYVVGSPIKFKCTVVNSCLSDYSYVYTLFIRTVTGAGADAPGRRAGKRNKQVIFKNCAPFADCISEVSNVQIDNAKDIDVLIPIYDLIEYGDNHSIIWKTSGFLWQYYKMIQMIT